MIIHADNIACVRGGRQIFSGLSFALVPGESLSLSGPNGVGKSTLLRLIAGLLTPAEGTIEISASVALADERLALDPELRLEDALSFWAEMDAATPAMREAAMAQFALLSLGEVPVRMLSTGQRRRAMLARAFASSAKLILLDEPGNGLDSASMTMLGEAMAGHLAGGGAIVAASHFDLPHEFTRMLNIQEYAA